MERVKKVTDILKREGCIHWIDSGTLLGVVRDGALIPSDHDIDISALYTPSLDVQHLRRVFQAAGYEVIVMSYEGQVFKLMLHEQGKQARGDDRYRVVDIRIFYPDEAGKFVQAVQIDRLRFAGVRGEKTFRRYFYSARVRIAAILHRHLPKVAVDNFFMRLLRPIVGVGCWRIPADFVKEIPSYNDMFHVPDNHEEYLEYRYGDWRVPNSDWNFRVDDPTLLYLPVGENVFSK